MILGLTEIFGLEFIFQCVWCECVCLGKCMCWIYDMTASPQSSSVSYDIRLILLVSYWYYFIPGLLIDHWCIFLRCTMWWFNTRVYCKMITKMRLIDISIPSQNYCVCVCVCVCVLVNFKIYSLNNFQVYNTVLMIIVTMLYIRSPELIHLIVGSL